MPDRPTRFKRTTRVMGTVASIHVDDGVDPERIEAAIAETFAELERIEAVFTTFRPTSVISRINRGELALVDAPQEVIEVLDACTWLEHASNGAFRARRPEPPHLLDPAGFVKGWAAERAARQLEEAGLRSWYLSVGGDLMARGRQADGTPWSVGVVDPFERDRVLATFDLIDSAAATSGTAERGAHLWDGRGGAPHELVQMTVIGPSLTWADAFATAAFAIGRSGVDWVSGFAGYGAIAVDREGSLSTSLSTGSAA